MTTTTLNGGTPSFGSLKCEKNKKCFSTFVNHIRYSHGGNRIAGCSKCEKESMFCVVFDNHSFGSLKCEKNKKCFSTFVNHIRYSHGGNRIAGCSKCEKESMFCVVFDNHIQCIHGKGRPHYVNTKRMLPMWRLI